MKSSFTSVSEAVADATSTKGHYHNQRKSVRDITADGVCLGYAPHAKQLLFHASRARHKIVMCGKRSGKTIAAAAEFVLHIYRTLALDIKAGLQVDYSRPIATRAPTRRYWVVAPTYELAREAQHYVWRFLPRTEVAKIGGPLAAWHAQEHRLSLDGGIEIHFRSAEDPVKLVGVSLDGVWFTEAARLKSAVWENIAPTLAEKKAWIIAESTPLGENWFYRELYLRGVRKQGRARHPDWHSFQWGMEDNPAIPPEEIARLWELLPPHVAEREIRGSAQAFRGQVYDLWSAATHVFDGIIDVRQYRRIIAGVDWGYVHAGAVVIVGVTGDGAMDVIAEEVAQRRPIPEWMRAYRVLRDKWHISLFYCDPSQPAMINELRGIASALEADNDVLAGIHAVSSLLHQRRTDGKTPRLRIHASCTTVIETMSNYRWRESQSYGVMEEPAQGQPDDALDALRYAVLTNTQAPAVRTL